MYRVVVADERAPRDGRFIEIIGQYQPQNEPSVVNIKDDRALYWLSKGAQPTDTAHKLLTITGVWDEFKKQSPNSAEARDVAAQRSKDAVKAKSDKAAKEVEAKKAAEQAEADAAKAKEEAEAKAAADAAAAAEAPAEEAVAEETPAEASAEETETTES